MATPQVSFKDKIKQMKITSFKFVDFRKEITSPSPENGNKRTTLLVFTISPETPIEKVVSSVTEWMPGEDKRVNAFKKDVQEVTIELDLIERYPDDNWVFDEDKDGNLLKTGSYDGDMMLDLSRQDRVWLTDVKFSRKSQEFREGKRKTRLQAILEADSK